MTFGECEIASSARAIAEPDTLATDLTDRRGQKTSLCVVRQHHGELKRRLIFGRWGSGPKSFSTGRNLAGCRMVQIARALSAAIGWRRHVSCGCPEWSCAFDPFTLLG